MDTLCGVGLPELVVIALIGFVVVGPERSRELGLTAGRWLRKAYRSAWWKEFNQISTSLKDLPNTLVRMADIEDDLKRVQQDLTQVGRVNIGSRFGVDQPDAAAHATDPWGIAPPPPPETPPPAPPTPSGEYTPDDF